MGPEERREGAALALAGLSEMGPRRLGALTDAWGVVGAWERIVGGDPLGDERVVAALGSPASRGETPQRAAERRATAWRGEARAVDPDALRARHAELGVAVLVHGSDRYPAVLAADREAPRVLFALGDLGRLTGARVGIVGTRRATSGGRQTAAELGADLAAAGVRVVSGLALGIDGAAHRGVLRAVAASTEAGPPIGVVGTGLDVAYPPRHRDLWDAVAEQGLLLSEVPLGGQPNRWRFPARNRLIAALSHLLVVVESHARGGALITVDEAEERGVPVMAVPGSVRVAACAGTNELLAAGAPPVLSAADVLTALDLDACRVAAAPERGAPDPIAPLPHLELTPEDRALLDDIGGEPIGLDRLADRAGIDPGSLSVRLLRLEGAGLIERAGATIEPVDRR